MARNGRGRAGGSGRDFRLLFSSPPQHPDSGPEYSHSRTPPPTIYLGRASSSESDPSEDPTGHTSVHSSVTVRQPPPSSDWPPWPTPVVLPSSVPPGLPRPPSVPGSPSDPSHVHSAASVTSPLPGSHPSVPYHIYHQLRMDAEFLQAQVKLLREELDQQAGAPSTSAPPEGPWDGVSWWVI
ncbi:hypothetical protein POM88_041472 [Heracleum sosnowskyi]|uniref:Uncharacterized protein n=1 Tax=Heracleum sosnowskyi TaxID=360622 RepID=A0AAD8M9R4_9APIA|nr:hypothetical protein POM88_041472 [Heracleum sosnowskyi]